MDKVLQVYSVANFDAVKEPRGFIRCIELVLAIFAFATTTSPSSYTSIIVTCKDKSNTTINIPFSYPYDLHSSASFNLPVCSNSTKNVEHPYGDFTSASQFYVCVGVLAFLYCIAILLFYTFKNDEYQKSEKLVQADFFITIGFTVMWLISTSAWAKNLTDLKYYSSPGEVMLRHLPECGKNAKCIPGYLGTFSTLNVSICFGYLNMFLWGFNLWFLFKETKWFAGNVQEEVPSPSQPQQVPPISGSFDDMGLPA